MKPNLRIVHISGEISPFIAHTQVAQYMSDMIFATQRRDVETRVIVPFSSRFNERRHILHPAARLAQVPITFEGKEIFIYVRVAALPKTKIQVYFIHIDGYFTNRNTFHTIEGSHDEDRIIIFSKAVIEVINRSSLIPDIIQCNDWITSLIPFYLKNSADEKNSFSSQSIFMKYKIENNFPISQGFTSKVINNGNLIDNNVLANIPITHLEDLVKIGILYSDFSIFTDGTAKESYPRSQSYSLDISHNFIENYKQIYNEIQSNHI
ncbi:MAG: glycogen/starch synthase [Chitinophagaceae bacterium]|nr:glycogen/starch synthase [Chitinophagaceae bacterium]